MDYKDLSKKALGNFGESLAADYLEQAGLKIIERNYRCPKGEIDIVAKEGDLLVFIEVRARTSAFRGSAEESISFQKVQRLKSIGSYYLIKHNYREWPSLRFDVVAIYFSEEESKINWIKNIF